MTNRSGSGGAGRPEPDFLEAARVLKPWGLRGEMKVEVLTSHPEDLSPGQRVFIGDAARAFEVQSARTQGAALILKVGGFDTPEAVEELRGAIVRIVRASAAPLRPNEYYHHQIIGLAVVTLDGDELGRVTDILATGANDVYVVNGPRGEVLLPARAEVIQAIDLKAGVMRVTLLPGLLPDSE